MKIKKLYFLIVLFLGGLSVGNVFAAAPAAGHLGRELRTAVIRGDEAEVKRLIAAEADVDTALSGFTALMYAASSGYADIVRLLLDAKANVNATTNYERKTALMYAAQDGHADIVELLLDAEADVNAQDNNGMTALMYAAEDGHADTIMLLLSAGADKNIKDRFGRTAESLARYAEYDDHDNIADMIRDYRPGGLTKSALKR